MWSLFGCRESVCPGRITAGNFEVLDYHGYIIIPVERIENLYPGMLEG
jgi:hypothetical protein